MIRILALSLCVLALHASEAVKVLMPLANGFNIQNLCWDIIPWWPMAIRSTSRV